MQYPDLHSGQLLNVINVNIPDIIEWLLGLLVSEHLEAQLTLLAVGVIINHVDKEERK